MGLGCHETTQHQIPRRFSSRNDSFEVRLVPKDLGKIKCQFTTIRPWISWPAWGAQPAVAFHEEGVVQAITAILTEMGLGYRRDGYGNIILRLQGRHPDVPPLALVAHMDHPGFEAVDTQGDFLIGEALGGVPAASFCEGVPLQVVLKDGRRVSALTAGPHGQEGDRRVLIKLAGPQSLELPRPWSST